MSRKIADQCWREHWYRYFWLKGVGRRKASVWRSPDNQYWYWSVGDGNMGPEVTRERAQEMVNAWIEAHGVENE